MIRYIDKASLNYFRDHLGLEIATSGNEISNFPIATHIDASYHGGSVRVLIGYDLELAQTLAKMMLDEEESVLQTLIDVALETTNIIVGSAKVIASDDDYHFNISTPMCEENSFISTAYETKKFYTVTGAHIGIALKEM